MILTCSGIKKSFGAFEALKDVSFIIEEGEKAAVVGVNGAGKTTLIRIIAGEDSPDGGDVAIKKGVRIGYLSQMEVVSVKNTVEEELLTIFSPVLAKETQLRKIENDMKNAEGEALSNLMSKYEKLAHEFESSNGYEIRSRVRGTLTGLGFSSDDANRQVLTMSSGQKTRIALCKLLLTAPEILLLDEPTNHLDIESVEWLEDVFLKNYPGSVIVISHDRYFLDKTVTKIIELEGGKSSVYLGNYSHYCKRKEEDREFQLKHFNEQQKEIKRQEDMIRRLYSYATEKKIITAKSKQKRLDMMERLEKPEDLPDKMRLTLLPRKITGHDVLFVKNLSKSFDTKKLFENVTFDIKRGENVALIGVNGVGKTTLLSMIVAGNLSNIKYGTNVEVGYFDQEYLRLDDNKSIFNEISDEYPFLTNAEIRNTLAAFVFTGDDVFKQISALSGGEKGRVALAKLMLSNSNFLILDEPTNHLDVFSKEILEDALRAYMGTVLYVSHDRYFINGTADRILELTPAGINQYLGDYDYYIEKKSYLEENSSYVSHNAHKKEERERKKSEISIERSRKAQTDKTEQEINRIEQEITEIDHLLTTNEIATDAVLCAEYYKKKVDLEALLATLYQKWDELN